MRERVRECGHGLSDGGVTRARQVRLLCRPTRWICWCWIRRSRSWGRVSPRGVFVASLALSFGVSALYHLFHAFTIAASACHFVAISRITGALAS